MSARPHPRSLARQRGAALLLIVLVVLITGLGILFNWSPTTARTERSNISGDALAQAKVALIGYAVTYRDTHPNESYGYLPCPDTDNDGVANEPCGATDVTVVGRLPWKTLGLPSLRDGSNECLWYAVSGRAKNNPKTAIYNWDTIGQFQIQDPTGNVIAGAASHDQPFAIIFAAGPALPGQTRASAGTSECGGSNAVADYLEGLPALGTGTVTVTAASAETIRNATNNDAVLWITPREIFAPIRGRPDFKVSIDTLLADIVACTNGVSQATIAASLMPTATGKGIDNLYNYVTGGTNCVPYNQATSPKRSFLDNWRDNLLYSALSATDMTNAARKITVNGVTDCKGILVFGGQRTAAQTRTNTGDSDNYLETLLASLPKPQSTAILDGTAFTGGTTFDTSAPSTDVATCIRGLPMGATQSSFASDFTNFSTAGGTGAVVANADQTVSMQEASGTTGGCFWFNNAIPLAGKTLRAFYKFKFAYGDTFALHDGSDTYDNGYGFTLQFVAGDNGTPYRCGTESNMGALTGTVSDIWGNPSIIVETDVRYQSARGDPTENHTAVMLDGNMTHSAVPAVTATCDGGLHGGCAHTPANKFEESPTPLLHNQRIEINTGCDATCTTCKPASHVSGASYAKVTVWVDCSECNDVSIDLNRATHVPAFYRCTRFPLNSAMDTVYVGLTGGFTVGNLLDPLHTSQGVTIEDFIVRSE